jgi:hypothetical protein
MGNVAGIMQGAQGQAQAAAGAAAAPGGPGAPTDPGGFGQAAVGLGDLGSLIERWMAQPGQFGQPEIQGIRSALGQEREEARRGAGARINADAARRGVFHSTIPALSQLGVEKELAGQEAMADAQLLSQAAQSRERGLQSSIGMGMDFMNQGQQNAIQQALATGQLGNMMMGQGTQGAPNMNSGLAALMQMGGGGAQGLMDPNLMAMLGNLFGGGQAQ